MAARWTRKHITVEILDGASLDVEAGPGEGDFSLDPLEAGNVEALPVMDRGTFDGFIEGDDLVQSFSITVALKKETLTNELADRILDAIRKTGFWASATTTDPNATVHALKVRVTITDGSTTATITLPCCRIRGSLTESKEAFTLSISGTNHQAPTFA